MQEVNRIIKAAGGAVAISKSSGGKISKWAPEKWCQKKCIPEQHWGLMVKLAGASIHELHKINEAARLADSVFDE